MIKKCARYQCLSVILCFFLLNTAFSDEPLRQWTDSQGKKAVARLVKIENDQITLRSKQGKTFTLRLSRLSADDNLYIQKKQQANRVAPRQVPTAETLLKMAAGQANRISAPVSRTAYLLWIATLQAEHGFDDANSVSQAYSIYHTQEANTQLEMLPDFLAYHASVGDLGVSRSLLDKMPDMACRRVSTYTTEHIETVWVDEERTEQVAETVRVPCDSTDCDHHGHSGCCGHSRTETVYHDETYTVRVPENVISEQTHYNYFTSPPTEAETLAICLKYADTLAYYAHQQETQHILAMAEPLIASLPRNARDQSLAQISQVHMDIGDMPAAFQVSDRITLSSLRVRSLCDMAKIYLSAGDKREFERCLEDAYGQVTWEMETANTPRDQAVAAAGLNEVLAAMLFNDELFVPDAFIKEARKLIPKLNILGDRVYFCMTLADIYLKTGNHAQARALQTLLPEFKIPLLAHIVDVQTAGGEDKEAGKTLRIMRSHVAKLKNTEDRLLCLLHCAVRQKKLGMDKQAAAIFTSTEKAAAKIRDAAARQRVYHYLCEAYASVFDFGNAEKMLLQLKDARLRNDMVQKIAQQKIGKNMPEGAYSLGLIAADGETAANIFIALAKKMVQNQQPGM